MFPHNCTRSIAVVGLSRRQLVALLWAMVVCTSAQAADPPSGVKLKPFVRARKSSSTQDHAAEYVQKAPGFFLRDGDTKIIPSGAGYLCLLERAQGELSQFWVRTQDLRGWAPTSELVPLNHAEAFFSQQIARSPRDAFAYLMRGIVRLENDDPEHAFADVDYALVIDPSFVAALVKRAYFWQYRNRLDLALADVNKAIELDPRNSYAFVERGVFHFTARNYAKALRDFERANELGSRSPVAHLCRGMIHLERREAEPAIAEFNHTLRADPKGLDAYVGLAWVYAMKLDHNKALSVFSRAIEVMPQSADAYEARAMYLVSRGRFDKAVDDLNQAVKLEPASADRVRNRARVFFERGEFERALADLDAAVRIEPDDAEAQQGRAWILATSPIPKFRNGQQAVVSATRACELTGWIAPHGLATLAAAYS
jgi:tetratricopeptide (TPR) repeat protein